MHVSDKQREVHTMLVKVFSSIFVMKMRCQRDDEIENPARVVNAMCYVKAKGKKFPFTFLYDHWS